MKKKSLSLKKGILLCAAVLIWGGSGLYAAPVDLTVGDGSIDPYGNNPGQGKGPVTIPSVDLDGYELSFFSQHDDYTLELRQGGVVVYSTFVSSTTNTVILPSTLQGEYEIRLYGDESYYLTGYISLGQ